MILGLTDYLDRRPVALSGGQRQRVAMGRAIVRQPVAYLFDEPLSNLDAKLRVEMRAEIVAMQQRVGATTIYVTHDQIEAMSMGDRIVLLRDGQIEQIGRPMELYLEPRNLFVARFIGTPPMNIFEAASLSENSAELKALIDKSGAHWVGMRPEHLMATADDALMSLQCYDVQCHPIGSTTQVTGQIGSQSIEAAIHGLQEFDQQESKLFIAESDIFLFDQHEQRIEPPG